jgi:hypothetical protein
MNMMMTLLSSPAEYCLSLMYEQIAPIRKLSAVRKPATSPSGADEKRNRSQASDTKYDDEAAAIAGRSQMSTANIMLLLLVCKRCGSRNAGMADHISAQSKTHIAYHAENSEGWNIARSSLML